MIVWKTPIFLVVKYHFFHSTSIFGAFSIDFRWVFLSLSPPFQVVDARGKVQPKKRLVRRFTFDDSSPVWEGKPEMGGSPIFIIQFLGFSPNTIQILDDDIVFFSPFSERWKAAVRFFGWNTHTAQLWAVHTTEVYWTQPLSRVPGSGTITDPGNICTWFTSFFFASRRICFATPRSSGPAAMTPSSPQRDWDRVE